MNDSSALRSDILLTLKNFKNNLVTIQISITDFNFTNKIISENVNIKNLKFCLTLKNMGNIESCIKTKYIPTHVKSENIKIEFIDFSFDDLDVDLKGIENDRLYGLKVEVIETESNGLDHNIILNKRTLKTSNLLLFNLKYGLINQDRVSELHKKKYGKKIICQSEKEAIKNINKEIELDELGDMLSINDIKSLTLENRYYDRLDKFINSNSKFSRKMTDDRKKKILFGANTRVFFEEKILLNNIKLKDNPFLKNEWFMGGIYSYDNNYKKFI